MDRIFIKLISIREVFAQDYDVSSDGGGGGGLIPGGGTSGTRIPGGGTSGGRSFPIDNWLKFDTIKALLDAVVDALITIAIPIIAIMIIWGAYQILFAAGDQEKFRTGKRTIVYAVAGAAIVLVAKGITALINQLLK